MTLNYKFIRQTMKVYGQIKKKKIFKFEFYVKFINETNLKIKKLKMNLVKSLILKNNTGKRNSVQI